MARRLAHALLIGFGVLPIVFFGCGIGNTVETSLDPVDAMDDQAATSMDLPVEIAILANDLQDDDLVTLVDIVMVDEADGGGTQPGAAKINFLDFPETIIYTPPTGFVGTVTFEYTITGFGITYDYTTTDTAIVTVEVTEGLPGVVAVDDMAVTSFNEPVLIDVLLNDMQDADVIDSFTDAVDEMDNVQVGSVVKQSNGADELLYTPPTDFAGTVTFEYDIVGAGVGFEENSVDTGLVTVEVDSPLAAVARVQFADRSELAEEDREGILFYITQESIDNSVTDPFTADGAIIAAGGNTECLDVEAGFNIPVRANIFFEDFLSVDGVCTLLAVGMDYTIQVQPDGSGGYEIACLNGLAEPGLCN